MRAVREILVWQFYRRNLFFFALALLLLFMVFRPPTLLVSAYFMQGMLEDIRFFGVIASILCLYSIKALYETWQAIHTRENHALYVLGALPRLRLIVLLAEQVAGVLLPGIIYAGIIAARSLLAGTWHAWAIMAFYAALIVLSAVALSHEVLHPRERVFRRRFSFSWMEWWTRSIPYIFVSQLLHHRRIALMVSKGVVLALLSLTLWVQDYDPMPEKGILLIFMCLASLQAVIPFWLTEHVHTECQWLRNFPMKRMRRFRDYAVSCLVMAIPEGLVIAGLTGLLGLPLVWTAYYLLGVLAVFLLAIAALHYMSLTMETFLKWLFGAFAVLFFAILFAIPQWILYPLAIAFAGWVFADEYYNWEG